jgi:transcriptional antiterminator RfaH
MNGESYDTLKWYLVRTKPRDETRVIRYFNLAGYSFLLPTFWKTSCAGKKKEKKPLFPGYVFIQLVLSEAYHKIHYTRGVSGFVRFGNMPTSVPEEIIEILKQKMRGDGTVKMYPASFVKGTSVIVTDGVLKGFEGVFLESLNDGHRIAILLKGLNSARVEVDRSFVSAVI